MFTNFVRNRKKPTVFCMPAKFSILRQRNKANETESFGASKIEDF
jgi:hypothetical protein